MNEHTECPIIPERLARLDEIDLLKGGHDPGDQMCALEAAAWLVGEAWTDHPSCVCPTIGAFLRVWNDGLPSDADRGKLLKPLIPRCIGTKGSDALAERRGYMALDWLIRVHTPRWLDLRDELKPHAKALRDLDEIVDFAAATAAGETVHAARDAAGPAAQAAAARAAARDAAGPAAQAAATRGAAWAAAWEAAQAAATRGAAWEAAWDAAQAAAIRGAAWEAAWGAAGAVAGGALKPTVEVLQRSASDLVVRMIETETP